MVCKVDVKEVASLAGRGVLVSSRYRGERR